MCQRENNTDQQWPNVNNLLSFLIVTCLMLQPTSCWGAAAAAAATDDNQQQQPPLPYQTLYYNNTVDHLTPFNPNSPTTFEHRYLLNDDYFGNGISTTPLSAACPGPIFLYTGNEGAITGFWNSNGFMHYLAQTYGGLLVFPEERYYGTSWPTQECCTYLTTQQVLEDYVELLNHVKQKYNARSCPTIAFGGSYGGTLAAYMRYAYPFAIQGALSASAELGYYDLAGWHERNITQYTFAEVVAEQYSKFDGCFEAISDASDAIEEADNQTLLDIFNFCDDSALEPRKSSIFTYGLEGLPQGNYPYQIGSMPAWPVAHVCEIMVNDTVPLLNRAASVTAITMGYDLDDGDKCLTTPEEGPGNVPGDGPGKGPGGWGYQSCTETLHVFSSSRQGRRGVRNFDFETEIDGLLQLCIDLYDVVPDTNVLAERYGGFDIAKTITNTIFSSGGLDPWGGAAILARDGGNDATERGVHFFRMENGAHHLDLRGWHEDDPADVTAVRKQEEEIIMGWVNDWANGVLVEQYQD